MTTFEKINMKFFAWFYAIIAAASLVAVFCGYTWHIWTFILSAVLSAVLFTCKDDKKPETHDTAGN